MKIEPGVMVLVIGPTIKQAYEAAGHYGVATCWVTRDEPLDGGMYASGSGWYVDLKSSIKWRADYSSSVGVFPASSLMPIIPGAESDDASTDTPIGETVEA